MCCGLWPGERDMRTATLLRLLLHTRTHRRQWWLSDLGSNKPCPACLPVDCCAAPRQAMRACLRGHIPRECSAIQ
jgi:hypothetical protein